jgi:diguanylate cyclase (GGDEF)-like protein/PAS domain S-box-containing protein
MTAAIRILYIDDNAHDRELVRDALEREHDRFQVTAVRSRAEFEAQLAAGDFDLVLSDFNILGFTGLQVLDAVRAKHARLPVVIVTGTGSEEIGVEAMKRGAADYVIKTPRHIQRLPQSILTVLEKLQLQEEREIIDAQLRESEALFHTLARGSPVGIFRTDATGEYTYVNERWCAIAGLDAPAAVGRGWARAVHSVERENITGQWFQSVAAGGAFQAEFRFLRSDGEITWVLGQGLPELNDRGELRGYVGTITDITERNRDRQALELQARIIDQIHDAVAEVDMEGIVRRWNKGSERLLGYTAEEMIGRSIERIYPAKARQSRKAELIEPVLRKGQHEVDVEHVCKDGRHIWVHLSLSLLRDTAGTPIGTLGYSIEITERLRTEEDLRLRKRALDASANGVVICHAGLPGLPIIYVNPAFETITGYAAAEALDRSCAFLHAGDREQPGLQTIRAALKAQVDCSELLRNYRKDGQLFWNELHIAPVRDVDGKVTHFVGIQNDVTERIEQQNDLVHRANHDELTGLANRHAMRESLDRILADERAPVRHIGVIVLNLDRLHHVNDTLGYNAGDLVLREAARRLQGLAAAFSCTAGRIGGDEFALVTGMSDSIASFESIAREATLALAQPYMVEGQSVYLTCCAGVSWSPDAGGDAAQLLGQADLALNLAKQHGRNQLVLYSAERSADMADRIEVGTQMRAALQREEIVLHYQPLIEARHGTIAGAEALMRWYSSNRGAISPGRFIPIAEDTGMIVPLGDWALRSAVDRIAAWHAAGRRAVAVSVNVSAVQFQRPEFFAEIEDVLRGGGVAPGLLKIEITESVVMQDAQTAVMLLNRLRQLGVRISLDDFGTGYSSLGYLRQLPIDEIKIDQSFVSDIIDDSYAATLCRAIIAMSQQLHLTVVAEGIETAAQAHFLRNAGCQLLQGFLFSKAVTAAQFDDLLVDNACWTLDGRRLNPPSTVPTS